MPPPPARQDGWSAPATVAVVALSFAGLVLTGIAATVPGPSQPWSAPPPPQEVDEQTTELAPVALELVEQASAPIEGPQAAPVPRVAQAWVTTTAAATGIPEIAVGAYGTAVLVLQAEQPACRVGWPTLAAIGAVESGHGSHGGSVLQADGTVVPPIIGPALDGNGVAAIRATPESSGWHGDQTWDHAVGPMQFIPSTWYRWGADGDGDGVANPQDVDDAALAAARYLCAGGRDLTQAAGWQAAVLSYNRSEQYVADVLAVANGYAAAAGRAP